MASTSQPAPPWASFALRELESKQRAGSRPYHEFLRVPELSAGLYCLPAGAEDHQRPHSEDELYYVIAGRARFSVAQEEGQPVSEAMDVEPGQVLFVRKGVAHRFHDIVEDLQVLVFFAPAEQEPA